VTDTAKSNAALGDKSSWPAFRSLDGWTMADLPYDLVGSLTLCAIAIPEQIATARLGGFAPQIGLFAFIAGSLTFAAFGANRYLSVGADSTITPIFAGGLALLAVATAPEYAALAGVLALLVGMILIVGGFFRLGWIADLLSVPVTTGFLAGIAVHILLSQAPALLGVAEVQGSVYDRAAALIANFNLVNPFAVAIGLGVLTLTFTCEALNRRIPGALIGLALATLATVIFRLDRFGVSEIGPVASALPHLVIPAIGFQSVIHVAPLAVIIALVIMMQTAATTRSFPAKGDPPNIDRDFIGVGVGNVIASLLGTFPVNASPPRTAIVAQTGGRSQLVSVFAAAIVCALIVFGATLLTHVPKAALAGVLFFIAQRIFRLRVFADIFKLSPVEFFLALATLAAIVIFPIQTGAAIGIFLSLLHGIFTVTRARPIVFERVIGTTIWWPPGKTIKSEKQCGVLVMGFQAPLSFLNAYDFRRGILGAIKREVGAINLFVLEASSIVEIDYSASNILADVIKESRSGGVDFAVARLESVRALNAFLRFGIADLLGPDHLFHSVEEAINTLHGVGEGAEHLAEQITGDARP
jgi:MFS superfamily sulfate permease-like transporter